MPDPQSPDQMQDSQQRQSWLLYQQQAEQAGADQKNIALTADAIILRASWHLRELAPHHEAIGKLLSTERKRAYDDALQHIRPQLEAFQYANAQHTMTRLVIPGVETEQLQTLDKRGEELEELAMPWLDVMALLGKIPKQTVATIKAGKGYLDRASDLMQSAELLGTHYKVIDQQAGEAGEGAKIITRAHLAEMIDTATKISGILTRQSGPAAQPGIDWKRQRMGTYLLANKSWESIRTAARFYFDEIGDKDAHKSLISLQGMRTFKLRP